MRFFRGNLIDETNIFNRTYQNTNEKLQNFPFEQHKGNIICAKATASWLTLAVMCKKTTNEPMWAKETTAHSNKQREKGQKKNKRINWNPPKKSWEKRIKRNKPIHSNKATRDKWIFIFFNSDARTHARTHSQIHTNRVRVYQLTASKTRSNW